MKVVCGVILNPQGQLLLAERPAGKVEAGRWEFPGGKIENNESEIAALERELKEELDLDVHLLFRLGEFPHTYSWGQITLIAYLGKALNEPRPMEQQKIRWQELGQVETESLCAAEIPVLKALFSALSKTSV